MNFINDKYDLRAYGSMPKMDEYLKLNQEMSEFKEQFLYFKHRGLLDLYSQIYDLQKRFNTLAGLIKDLDTQLHNHLHPEG